MYQGPGFKVPLQKFARLETQCTRLDTLRSTQLQLGEAGPRWHSKSCICEAVKTFETCICEAKPELETRAPGTIYRYVYTYTATDLNQNSYGHICIYIYLNICVYLCISLCNYLWSKPLTLNPCPGYTYWDALVGSPLAGFKTHWFCMEFERKAVNRNRSSIWPFQMEWPDWASIPVDRIPFKLLAKSMGFESGKGWTHESIPVSVSRARV